MQERSLVLNQLTGYFTIANRVSRNAVEAGVEKPAIMRSADFSSGEPFVGDHLHVVVNNRTVYEESK